MNQWYISYVHPLGEPTVAVLLNVTQNDGCMLIVTGPIAGGIELPEKQQIGVYRALVPPEMADNIRILTIAAIKEANSHNEPMRPGTQCLQFEYGTYGQPPDSIGVINLSMQDLPQIKKLETAVLPVMKKMLECPHNVLHGTAKCESAVLTHGNDLKITVELSSAGVEQVIFHNPLNSDTGVLPLSLQIEKDVPEDDPLQNDIVYFTLNAEEISDNAKRPEKGSSDECKLLPGKKLILHIQTRRKMYLSPGRYKIFVKYESNLEEDQLEGKIAGRLLIPAGIIEVK